MDSRINPQAVTIDFTNMTAEYLGEHGISEETFSRFAGRARAAHDYVKENRGKSELSMGWTELPYSQNEVVKEILATAREIRKKFDNFVIFGIGGSALGPMMAAGAMLHLHHNELPKRVRKAPRFYVEDNIDPVRIANLLDVIDLKKTCFNVISKSGETSETMAQLLILLDLLKRENLSPKEHLIFTTDAQKGNLVALSEELGGVKRFILPDGVGGRFSELSPVGLLPAAVLGIDVRALLKGAAFMDKRCKNRNLYENPALMCASLQVIAMESGKNIHVLMPYSDNLKYVADWYAQLWAESLGKNRTLDGKPCNTGQTPVRALGATDQHSQVQLYTEGPYDKVVTFLSVEKYGAESPIPGSFAKGNIAFLGGHSLEELLQAENTATAYALRKAGRMNYTVRMPEINAFTLGQLLFLFELQTAYAGAMLHIDAYNQPGVEEGKKATFALLGKAGYAEKKAEILNAAADPKFII